MLPQIRPIQLEFGCSWTPLALTPNVKQNKKMEEFF